MPEASVRVITTLQVVRVTNLDDDEPPVVIQSPALGVVRISQMGLQGPRGADGAGATVYEHQQDAESQQWIVNHNLGRKPAAVQVLSTGLVEVLADIVHISDNQLQVLFSSPYAGLVRVM